MANKVAVLCTRFLDEVLTHRAAANDVLIDEVAFIRIEQVEDETLTQTIRTLTGKPVTAVFTSLNSVQAVTAKLEKKPGWKIFCVGGTTKEHIYRFFGKDAVQDTAKNASALAEKIIQVPGLESIVFFCGDQRLNEIPETLMQHAIKVQEIVVYKNIPAPVFVEKDYDAIIFFSPSAVHSFFSVNTLPVHVVLFSIGKTTTAAIQIYASNLIITSEWPGKEQMVDLVVNYFRK